MKKFTTMAICFVLIACMVAGGSLAYLTDRDSVANVFTVGDVRIELSEDFAQGATLMPGKDIEKKPTIKNTGINDAWVWAQIAIPSALDNDDASANVIHFNFSEASVADGLWKWTDADDNYMVAKNVEINGVNHNVYTVLYETALKHGEETTEPVIHKVYMDPHIDIDTEGNWYHVLAGVATDLGWNTNTNGAPIIYVSAYAVQAEGFTTVQEAYAAYNEQWDDPTTTNKNEGSEWATPASVINDVEELNTAFTAGKDIVFTGNGDATVIDLASRQIGINGANVTINNAKITTDSQNYTGLQHAGDVAYNNVTFDGSTFLYGESVTFNKCTFNLTSNYIWAYGAKEVNFNDCTFNTNGKAILVYTEGSDEDVVVNVKDCTFNATASGYAGAIPGQPCAAVEIDGSLPNGGEGTFTVNFSGTNAVDEDFSGLVRVKADATPSNVTVNGATVVALP